MVDLFLFYLFDYNIHAVIMAQEGSKYVVYGKLFLLF